MNDFHAWIMDGRAGGSWDKVFVDLEDLVSDTRRKQNDEEQSMCAIKINSTVKIDWRSRSWEKEF